MRKLIYSLLGLLLFVSCSKRNLAYFSNMAADSVYVEDIEHTVRPTIQSDDLLGITVSSLSPEANVVFNRGYVPSPKMEGIKAEDASSKAVSEGYLVDDEGYIEFPVLGKIKLGGLTKKDAKALLEEKLADYLKSPVVDIRFLNYRITVIGEVNRPATFTVPSDKISILTALGMAGDMTPYGKRENVLVIREEGGKREMVRLNLNSTEVFESPYYYLKQNDVVYVEPHKSKRVQTNANTARFYALASSVLTVVIVLITRI